MLLQNRIIVFLIIHWFTIINLILKYMWKDSKTLFSQKHGFHYPCLYDKSNLFLPSAAVTLTDLDRLCNFVWIYDKLMYPKIVSTWIFKLDVSKTWYIVRQTFAKLWKIDINFIQACHIISWKFLTEKVIKDIMID